MGRAGGPDLSVHLHLAGCLLYTSNENAPIFEIADYGICGDLVKVTPLLIEAIKAAKAAK